LFWLVARPELKTFSDLKGKTMAVTTIGGSQQLAGFHMLRKGGIDPMKEIISIVFGDVPAQLQAPVSGPIHITVLSPPTVFIARDRYKLNLLASISDEYANFISGLIVSVKRCRKSRRLSSVPCAPSRRPTDMSKPTRKVQRRYLRSFLMSVNPLHWKPTALAGQLSPGTAFRPTRKLKKI